MTARQSIAVCLCVHCAVSLGMAQQLAIAPIPQGPPIVQPYLAPEVPPVRLANSPRIKELIRAGTLYLTVQDAIALALENNIDIEVARYNPLIAQWNVTRSKAGGALPGVPSAASQAGAVASGQGVAGSQAAAGIRIPGIGANRSQTVNSSIQQIGPITQTLDPIIQESSVFSHTSSPQPNTVQSGIANLITGTRAHSLSYQQGFLTGGNVTVTYTDNYLNENVPTDVLNPSNAVTISIAAQQNLLQGFGAAVNSRIITVAKLNAGVSHLAFQTLVIGIVAQVLNNYFNLAAAQQDVKAKRSAADVAREFLTNVKEQVHLGALAPSETDNAEKQSITSDQALLDAETTEQQTELQLKNLLSRTGTADPLLAAAHIEPVDPLVMPPADELPPLDELVKQALANRSDLATERENEEASRISSLGTRNGVLPNLVAFAGESQSGIAGTARTVTVDGVQETAIPFFTGGLGRAAAQAFQRDFPSERGGAFYFAQLRNRQALADYAIDQLQYRQTQLTTVKDLNQVQVDVLNATIALRQARARYEAAVQNRTLQEQLFESEQKKFKLGASTPYNVIQQQRDLVAAQSTTVAQLAAYTAARISLERTLGTILTANHVSLVP